MLEKYHRKNAIVCVDNVTEKVLLLIRQDIGEIRTLYTRYPYCNDEM